MHRMILALSTLGLGMLTAAGLASAGGLTEAGELQAARLNALAGGPVSARDKELLERWGCLSGTTSVFCQSQAHRRYGHRARSRR